MENIFCTFCLSNNKLFWDAGQKRETIYHINVPQSIKITARLYLTKWID